MTTRYPTQTCIALLGLFLLAALPLRAQTFEPTGGPFGAGLSGVIAHEGEVLAAGVGVGTFQRVGETWETQPVNLRLGSFFRVGETLFAMNGNALYRSDDGLDWAPAWEGSTSLFSVAPTPGDSLLLLANDSMFVSGDGVAWRPLIQARTIVDADGEATGDTIAFISAVARMPDGTLWVSASGSAQFGLFRSLDAETWTFISPSQFDFSRLLHATSDGELYTVIAGEAFRYEAASESWLSLTADLGALTVQGFAESGDELFIHGYEAAMAALYKREGSAWTPVDLPVASYTAVVPAAEGVFVLGEDRLYRGPGDGTWTALDDGLVASYALPTRLGGAVVTPTRRGWMRSADEGGTWEPVSLPQVGAVYDFGEVAFATGSDDIYRSMDGGETWETVNEGINISIFHDRRIRHMAAHEGVYFGGLYSSRAIEHGGGSTIGGVYRSTDGGSSWALFGGGFPVNDDGFRAGVYRLVATEDYVIAATQEGLVRIAHDGTAWESLSAPSVSSVLNLTASGGRLFLATYQEVFVSDDHGLTWAPLVEGLPDGDFALTLVGVGETAFVLLRPLPDPVVGLYRLEGDTWVDTGVAVPDWVQFYDATVTDDYLFFGTSNHGVWRLALEPFTVASEPGGITVSTPELAPAFPNPTRARATLRLSLPDATDVRVEVFDVQGRRVAVLYDGQMEAGANHTLELDAAGLAAGVYLVRASSGDVLLDRRVTVVR